MNLNKSVFILIMIVFTLLLCLSCHGGENKKVSETESDSVEAADVSEEVSVDVIEPVAEPQVTEEEPATSVKQKQTNTSPSYGGKETLYISTFGANGKVWGHVTMNGKTGRGTIHDDDENSYSITVTRHGGELFGTDQNGRQYVFQL